MRHYRHRRFDHDVDRGTIGTISGSTLIAAKHF
jgi:hypothetical protein